MKFFSSLILAFVLSSCTAQSYNIVFSTDFDGEVISGSKEQLIAHIRDGKAVRVGWQLDFDRDNQSDLDHWIEANFITILEGEVFVQIDPIYAQGPNAGIPQVEIFPDNTKWTAIIGTNGKLLNRFVQEEDSTPELVFDESLGLSEAEKTEIIEKEQARIEAMRQVNTWNVTTSWSVQM